VLLRHNINSKNVTKQKCLVCICFKKSLYMTNFLIQTLNYLKHDFFSNLEINVFENPWRMETFIVP
jgi:hypothetical protein